MNRDIFNDLGCKYPLVFTDWFNSKMLPKGYTDAPLYTDPNLRNSIFTVVLLFETETKPTTGSVTLMSIYKGTNSAIYPGQNQNFPVADIIDAVEFSGLYDSANPGFRFSVVFNNPTPARCDGFIVRNNLDVNITSIKYCFVPIISLTSEVKIGV